MAVSTPNKNLKRRGSPLTPADGLPQAKHFIIQRELTYEAGEQQQELCAKHLVLVVPGIGQTMKKDKKTKIEDKLKEALEKAKKQLAKKAKKVNGKLGKPKVEYATQTDVVFRTVDWREALKLNDGAVESVSLGEGVQEIRKFVDHALCDVLYYLTPEHCNTIVHHLVEKMNREYEDFVSSESCDNPHVSILAHSLGSVITYDVLTETSHMKQQFMTPQKLKFKVDNFFAIGSPLGLFLSIRGLARPLDVGQTRRSKLFSLDTGVCENMYNIFHPYDAIAYRWEPLERKEPDEPVKLESTDSQDETDSNLELVRYDYEVEKSLKGSWYKNKIPFTGLKEALQASKAHTCYWKSGAVMEFILQKLHQVTETNC